MNKTYAAVALIAGLVIGYGITVFIGKSPGLMTGPCTQPHTRCADVEIVNNTIQPIGDIVVPGQGYTIFWNIVTRGYVFPANGISFVTPPIPPNNEFSPCLVMSGGTVFFCNDANSTHGSGRKTYKYTVTVTATSGSSNPTPLDPQIVNN